MPTLEEFCTINAGLRPRMLGKTPSGIRLDFAFEGTAESPHWEGSRPVSGVDYATIRSDGNLNLDIRGVIGEGRKTVSYRAMGVSIMKSKTEALPRELMTFETSDEDLSWLNTAIGVAVGEGKGLDLTLTVYIVKD